MPPMPTTMMMTRYAQDYVFALSLSFFLAVFSAPLCAIRNKNRLELKI
jgi:hypothetical protein